MPTHVYVGFRRPPTWFDHLLAHPYELIISGYGAVGGAVAFVSAFNGDLSVSRSMDLLPYWVLALAGLLLVLGGGGIYHGLFDSSDDLGRGFSRERQGLALSSAGWAVFGICIYALSAKSFLSWGLCVALVVANILRFVATSRQENGIRDDVKQGLK